MLKNFSFILCHIPDAVAKGKMKPVPAVCSQEADSTLDNVHNWRIATGTLTHSHLQVIYDFSQ